MRKEGRSSGPLTYSKVKNFGKQDLNDSNGLFIELGKIIKNRNIKGIVVGYPLDYEGKPMVHCNYVEKWIEHMWFLGVAKFVPVTLVNEHGTSTEAKVHIAK